MKTNAQFCREDCGLTVTPENLTKATHIYETGSELRRRAYARWHAADRNDDDATARWKASIERSGRLEARMIRRLKQEAAA